MPRVRSNFFKKIIVNFIEDNHIDDFIQNIVPTRVRIIMEKDGNLPQDKYTKNIILNN